VGSSRRFYLTKKVSFFSSMKTLNWVGRNLVFEGYFSAKS
jgi:hypothetical protein